MQEEQLQGAGSNRQYFRLTADDGTTVIKTVGISREENDAFVYIARHLEAKGLPVPHVIDVAPDGMSYIQQDLGSMSLFDAIAEGRRAGGCYNEKEVALLEQAIRLLPHVQVKGAIGMDWGKCYPQPEMDFRNAMFDLNYFKYCFLKLTGVDFHEIRLEDNLQSLANDITAGKDNRFFLYRDFQARNILVTTGHRAQDTETLQTFSNHPALYLIDFQGARKGSNYYDVASFLWQASAKYPDNLRSHLIDIYYNELATLTEVPPREEFDKRLRLFVFFRLLQVLGAYGFRGLYERKQHFINSIPAALESIGKLIDEGVAEAYPELKKVLSCINKTPISAVSQQSQRQGGKLMVRIFSFSYKKGIPEDTSGNGGGYVFDCRSTNNPGRYKEYKTLTGLDKPVIDFLEKDGEILSFLDHVYPLVDFHVQRWLDRGFTDLQVSFGCTGGQHRSVYSAQHVAEHIYNKFGIEVQLCHREQNITQSFK